MTDVKTAVYFTYEQHSKIVRYVGISNCPERRLGEHQFHYKNHKGFECQYIYKWYRNFIEAYKVEEMLITSFKRQLLNNANNPYESYFFSFCYELPYFIVRADLILGNIELNNQLKTEAIINFRMHFFDYFSDIQICAEYDFDMFSTESLRKFLVIHFAIFPESKKFLLDIPIGNLLSLSESVMSSPDITQN